MKTKIVFSVLVLFVLFSCKIQNAVSFADVSSPYIDKYGWPDLQMTVDIPPVHHVIYFYSEIGFDVCFSEIFPNNWIVYREATH